MTVCAAAAKTATSLLGRICSRSLRISAANMPLEHLQHRVSSYALLLLQRASLESTFVRLPGSCQKQLFRSNSRQILSCPDASGRIGNELEKAWQHKLAGHLFTHACSHHGQGVSNHLINVHGCDWACCMLARFKAWLDRYTFVDGLTMNCVSHLARMVCCLFAGRPQQCGAPNARA
jgi:hypothetical protein